MAFGLNSRQKSATTSQSQHALVLAGPGTGKTAVLADYAKRQASRLMARSTCSKGRKPRVLVLTHTINARDRVQSRINEMEPDLEVRQLISCMTFHGFALKMVNHHGKSRYVVNEDFEIDTVRKIISRKRFRNQINPEHAQDIVDINEAYRGKGTSITKVLKNYPKLRGHQKLVDQIIRYLEQAKEKAGVISPSDSVRLFMRLVNSKEISPSVLHKEFGAVAVDEFQDTLAAQWEMIKVVVGPKTRLLAAGDPGQCIFTWAGASLKRFDHFKDHYPKHEVHRLTRNYRSTTQILDFCNSVLNQSTLADVTKSRSKVAGLKPTVVLSPSPPNLCEYAAKEISKARDSGQPLSEIAVLYRFHNDKRILTGYLENARIPY